MLRTISTLPSELLLLIFKYIEDDYKAIYSCILVSKRWHNINISTLWKDPFISENSTKILINCLLTEDKNFLKKNDIKITFKLLKKVPLLYNYSKFATEL